MSEEVLNALIQLFALTSSHTDVTKKSREIITYSLGTELPKEKISALMLQYDQWIKTFHSHGGTFHDSADYQHVRAIAENINSGLTIFQRHVLILRLVEYIYADEVISEYEQNCLDQIYKAFKITETNYELLMAFITQPDITHQNILTVSGTKSNSDGHYYAKGINGVLKVCFIADLSQLFIRYTGNESLYINGRIVYANRSYVFSSGASIRGDKFESIHFSDLMSQFIDISDTQKLHFQAENISYQFNDKNYGMHSFSISENNGKLVGIMGGSGAGKSTLLNILNGSIKPSKGCIKINGQDIHQNPALTEGIIGYIRQDDLLIESLTVFENLYYSTKLCMDHLEDKELIELVNHTLNTLGLYNIKDLRVGSALDKVISGGQRKRLNIALEIIREPLILFVDEPTSGLSSRDSENIMDLLKQLTLKGKIVFTVIHQPSSDIFKLFDKLILLDLGGYPIYYGDPLESISYFKEAAKHLNAGNVSCVSCGNVNSEILFDIIEQKTLNEYGSPTLQRKVTPKEWYAHYLSESNTSSPEEESSSSALKSTLNTPNKLNQLKIFIQRDLNSKLSNLQYILINLFQAPILAFVISYFIKYSGWNREGAMPYSFYYNENIPAFLFMAVVVALFIGMTVSAEEIFKDRELRKREEFLKLSKLSYLFSKIIILLALSAFQTFLFVEIANYILQIQSMNLYYWGIIFSTAFFANMVGLNISVSFNSAVSIYMIIPFLIIPQLIFSGVLVGFDRLNPKITSKRVVPVIGELMASKWGYEALAVTQFKHNPIDERLFSVDQKVSQINFLKNYWIPEMENDVNYLLQPKQDSLKSAMLVRTINNEIDKTYKNLFLHEVKFKLNEENSGTDSLNLTKLKNYLSIQKQELNRTFHTLNQQRDRIIYQIESDSNYNRNFTQLKLKFRNEKLTQLLRRDNHFTKIIHHNDHLLQLSDPIYRSSSGFRSHFYAHEKRLFNITMDTYWVNFIVLWLMSLFLFITLYFESFKWVINQTLSLYSKIKGALYTSN